MNREAQAAPGNMPRILFLAQQRSGILEREAGATVMIAPYDGELFGHWWYEGPLAGKLV